MRVIGIDLGTLHCGYGIVEVAISKSQISNLKYIISGVIEMNKKDSRPMRLKSLYLALKRIINEYKPSHLCIERVFYHKSIHSAFILGEARGIAMLLAGEVGIPVFEYNSTELKKALTGYGRAEKSQVREMVIRILNIKSKIQNPKSKISLDTADALALCICHINSSIGYEDSRIRGFK